MAAQKRSTDSGSVERWTDVREYAVVLDGDGLRLGIVMSCFNEDIGAGLLSACMSELRRLRVKADDIALATVPGALEIPLTLQQMAGQGTFAALIALGAVIRGETYHFEVVANEASRGLMDVQLRHGIPIANGILTCDDDDQALVRMHQKGTDCARVAIHMARLLQALERKEA